MDYLMGDSDGIPKVCAVQIIHMEHTKIIAILSELVIILLSHFILVRSVY